MTDDSALPSFKAWSAVALLWVVALLNYLDRLTITTIREPLIRDVPMSEAQFGLLTSLFLWIYGFASPGAGYLADRFGRRRVILASLAIWSFSTWMTGHMSTFGGLLAARAIMGLSEACYIPAAMALIADYHSGRSRSLATGLHMTGIYAGAALGGVGAEIAEFHGWRAAFTALGGAGLAYAVVVALFLKEAPRQVTPAGETLPHVELATALKALLTSSAFLLVLAANTLVGIANWGIYGWLPTYMREHFQLGLGKAGITATAYVQIASFTGVVLGGLWADRWSATRRSSRSLVPAIGYVVAAPLLLLTIGMPGLAIALVGLVGYGLGRGFFDSNLMPLIRTTADERYSATGYGLMNLVSCVAGGVMIYVGGVLRDHHVDLMQIFRFSAMGLFLAAILLFLANRASRSCP